MHASLDDNRQRLFTSIVSAMQGCGRMTAEILDYVDATLFPPEAHCLKAFLDDDDDCEQDSLLDLIFYPEIDFQIRIEPLLVRVGGADTERALSRRLEKKEITAAVHMPDGRLLTQIVLPEFIKTQFLTRLKVDWPMDATVTAAIEAGVSAALRSDVRVRLRNSGLVFSDTRRLFLVRFFERLPDDTADYLACLDLVLPLLAGLPADADMVDLLVDRKRALFKGLQQLNRFEDQRCRSTMETLMLQGVRMPYISRESTMREMGLIDRICMGVFGRTETIAMPLIEPVRQVEDLDTPAAAVRSLMR